MDRGYRRHKPGYGGKGRDLNRHKVYYDTAKGAVSVNESIRNGNMHLLRRVTARGLRPGKQVDVVQLGRAIVRGDAAVDIAKVLGINRKTVWRWKKRLRLDTNERSDVRLDKLSA